MSTSPPEIKRRPRRTTFGLRRTIQALALLIFLVLLLGVSWPHSAKPAQSWAGWMPVEFDRQTGRATLACPGAPPSLPGAGTVLYVVDESDARRDLGPFRVVRAASQELVLAPELAASDDQRRRLAESIGPWSLHEARPGDWPSHFADDLAAKERLPAETFLMLDPLVSLATGIASGQWSRSALWAAAILLVCLVVPRAFCAYLCPLGTLADLFDWAVRRRRRRFAAPAWLARLRFATLAAVLAAAAGGLMVAGFVAPIPLVARALADALSPLLEGFLRGWHQVPPWGAGQAVSLGLLVAVLGLGIVRPRFWCRYLCPSGAMFSIVSLAALVRRHVDERCTGCGRCANECPLGAAGARSAAAALAECGFCRACATTCPTDAVQFVPRWKKPACRPADEHVPDNSRRRFLGTAASAAVAAAGSALATRAYAATARPAPLRLRPPGSVPEDDFLRLCVRCGACLRACASGVLQAVGFEGGVEGLWTPQVVADGSGCEPSCNRCGQVCPTGAIRALPLDEKRRARIGLAVVDAKRCLPHAGKGDCRLCVDDCTSAGYAAIEIVRVGTEIDGSGQPVEDSGFAAPRVIAEQCVGCGLCQSRCRAINVLQNRLLEKPAIIVEAVTGSQATPRQTEKDRPPLPRGGDPPIDDYLPQF